MSSSLSKEELEIIRQADQHAHEEQLLQAARLLRQVRTQSLLTDQHQQLLQDAVVVEAAVQELLSDPLQDDTTPWHKQGESHGTHDTSIYYKFGSTGKAQLTCRMESPIPCELLVPLLAVLNESSLYHTWVPSWTRPVRVGIRSSQQVARYSRGHQRIRIVANVPWPLHPREVLMDAFAVDDIDHDGCILCKMRTPHLPEVEPPLVRADYDGAILFRPCPNDHVHFASSVQKHKTHNLLLVQFTTSFDAHMEWVPPSLIQFVTRTVIGRVWSMLLEVARQVQGGTTRPQHQVAIARQKEFYEWVHVKCQGMMMRVTKQEEDKDKGETFPCENEPEDDGDGEPDWTMQDVWKMTI